MTIDLKTLVVSNLATVIGAFITHVVMLYRLKDKVDTLSRDVDGIAEVIGTPRAIARLKSKTITPNKKGE